MRHKITPFEKLNSVGNIPEIDDIVKAIFYKVRLNTGCAHVR
jgi:hypothetical protein